MDYLIRFIQMHSSFRKPEIDALAELAGVRRTWISYSENSPFALIRLESKDEDTLVAAKALIARSILSYGIYELWGSGHDYPSLHDNVRQRTSSEWEKYKSSSFRFEIDAFQGSHSPSSQREIIEAFSYTGFEGPIKMTNPDNQFTVFEDFDRHASEPKSLHLGRLVAESGRKAIAKYTLKKREYIATTSMDAELSLVTANLALAGPGKLAYDPFMGTGSFPLACAHFGAHVFGSDLDGRSIRGKKNSNKSVKTNFAQYNTSNFYLGGLVADLTNTPLRSPELNRTKKLGYLDAILCDPPYGVREGLKVLGSTRAASQEIVMLSSGTPAHLSEDYIPPKKPYSFVRMLEEILAFSASTLVEGGRLCMWMPVAGVTVEEDGDGMEEFAVPRHPALEVVGECMQRFNKWSRRLVVYRRRREGEVDLEGLRAYEVSRLASLGNGGVNGTADDLNAFRKKYFQGFIDPSLPRKHEVLPHSY